MNEIECSYKLDCCDEGSKKCKSCLNNKKRSYYKSIEGEWSGDYPYWGYPPYPYPYWYIPSITTSTDSAYTSGLSVQFSIR